MGWINTDYFENRSARLILSRQYARDLGIERELEEDPEHWAMFVYNLLQRIDEERWKNAVVFGLRVNVEQQLRWEIFIHDKSLSPVPEGEILPEIDITQKAMSR